MLIIDFPNDGRKLKQFITGLLKSGSATEIKRINYIKSYKLDIETKNIKKTEKKLILINFLPENKEKLEIMIKKLHPQKNIEIKYLTEDIIK